MPALGPPPAYARCVLRITDARTGRPVDAAPVRRRLTRVEAHVRGHDTGALRVLLVADLLVRTLELGGTPVWPLLTGDRDLAELRADGAALGIRPFEDTRDVGSGLGESQVVHVLEADGTAPGDGVLVAVAPVDVEADDLGHPEALRPGHPSADRTDPAVLRLALLSLPRATPARLDKAALTEAGDTLRRWRRAVAGWARQPSRPVPDQVRARLRAAWEDDLDVPEVLRVLADVEASTELPEGARFETYVYADRLLALELSRDLGSPA